MKFDIEVVSDIKRVFKIEVPAEVISKEFSDAYDALKKRARIPGFRPGKTPVSILEKRFGKEVEEDLIKKIVPDYYLKAVKESGLTPVSMPEIEILDINKGEPLIFTATVEVKPNVEVVTFEGIELKKEEVTVTEEEIDSRIKEILDMNAQLEVAEENYPLANGDFVQIDYTGYKDGKPAPGIDRQDVLFQVGTGQFGPELDAGVLGARKGEEKEVMIPADNLMLKVTIQEVKKKVLPELNDDFAKDVGGFNSLTELKDSVREKLTDEKTDTLNGKYKTEIVKKLIERHPIEAPPAMVEREMGRFLSRTKKYMNRQGAFEPEEEKSIREKYTPYAVEEIKGDILLMAIGEQEGISATDEEVENEINKMAKKHNQDVQRVRKSIEALDNGMEGLRIRVTVEKVLGLVKEKAIWS
ncbi:MAG: trigger factor [Nitrospirae bacterium]|nr:trigger factor [Nitrospirota bacterium]